MEFWCPESVPASLLHPPSGHGLLPESTPNHTLLEGHKSGNFRATAIRLGPGILTSDICGERFFLGQNCRIKLLIAKRPHFINVDFKNTIQPGIKRNCIVPLRVLIFINNNTGLWSHPEKKILEMLPEERRRQAETKQLLKTFSRN